MNRDIIPEISFSKCIPSTVSFFRFLKWTVVHHNCPLTDELIGYEVPYYSTWSTI